LFWFNLVRLLVSLASKPSHYLTPSLAAFCKGAAAGAGMLPPHAAMLLVSTTSRCLAAPSVASVDCFGFN